ncbi:Rap1a/Tai family immunity protein [Saccharospirillum salsuginis]
MLVCCTAFGKASNYRWHISGNELLEICESNSVSCYFFAMGGFETYSLLKGTGQATTDLEVCMPPEATGHQIADIVTAYLKRIPADRHRPAALLSMYALSEAFPCGYE